MEVTIVNIDSTHFSINGIPYLKHFISIVTGDNVEILNVYDSKVILQKKTTYSDYTLDAASFGSATLLQAALVDVLFVRVTYGGIPTLQEVTTAGATTSVFSTFTEGAGSSVDSRTRYGFNAGLGNSPNGGWAAIGSYAAEANTSGDNFTAIGSQAGMVNVSGYEWTAVGYRAAWRCTGTGFTALGNLAGEVNLAGDLWTAIGNRAAKANASGSRFVSVGYGSGGNNLDGTNWVSIGAFAGGNANSSEYVALGYSAAEQITGNNWVALGAFCASDIVGGATATSVENSTYVGYHAKVSVDGVTNENVFGYMAEGKGPNTVTLGNDDVEKVHTTGTIHIPNEGNSSQWGQGVVIGQLTAYAGVTAPNGWKTCDGALLLVADYPELFAVIGDRYGGDGVTDFRLPNLVEKFPLGTGATYPLATEGGNNSLVLQETNLPAHNHTAAWTQVSGTSAAPAYSGEADSIEADTNASLATTAIDGLDGFIYSTQAPDRTMRPGTATTTGNVTVNNTGSGTALDNMPSFLSVNWIIRVN